MTILIIKRLVTKDRILIIKRLVTKDRILIIKRLVTNDCILIIKRLLTNAMTGFLLLITNCNECTDPCIRNTSISIERAHITFWA